MSNDAGIPSRLHWIVEGRVQGVHFRSSTERAARAAGELSGYARNLVDGSVEVEAAGDQKVLQVLAQWLQEGPEMARVDRLRTISPSALALPEPFEAWW